MKLYSKKQVAAYVKEVNTNPRKNNKVKEVK